MDFDENIYDQALSIEFLCKIRGQVKFNSVEELKIQINEDKNKARELLKSYER
jgi:riboflavin kinase/FMN adenylyltransferase